MQHQRLAEQRAHHAAGEGDVAAQANQHVGLDAANHLQRLPESAQQAQRQQEQRFQALTAHTPEIDQLQRKAARRHQAALHAAGCAQPVHAPAALAQGFGHGQTGENVAAGAAGHDQGARLVTHDRPPFMSWRFS
ncbi:hypothetical protein D9M68_872210 [compost metagenome]